MGTATFTITDNETGVSVVLRMDDSGLDISGGDTDSPPPSSITPEYKRAIVIHPIPQFDFDVGQDMGMNALKFTISGLCRKAVRDQLVTWVQLAQYTAANPAGRMSVVALDRSLNTLESFPALAMESLVPTELAGSPKWWKVTVGFLKVSPSQ